MKRLFGLFFVSMLLCVFSVSANAIMIESSLDNINEGSYIIKISKTDKDVKANVIFENQVYTYTLSVGDNYIPLQFGNGTYEFEIFENVYRDKYKKVGVKTVNIDTDFDPFLSANSIVNISTAQNTIKETDKIITKKMTDEEKIEKLYNFVITNLSYDYRKDVDGLNSDIDKIMEEQEASYSDYAVVLTTLLRNYGIPSKLALGKHESLNTDSAFVIILNEDTEKWIEPFYERENKYIEDASNIVIYKYY